MSTDAMFWNNVAEKYSKDPVRNVDAFERKIAITKAKMAPTDRVLDIGCGTGSLALRLAETGAELHGLDVSSEMIRIANDKAAKQGAANVTFHTGAFDDRFAAFEPQSLDGICAYSILHLVADRPAALSRMFQLLKPGGFLVTSTAVLGEGWIPFKPLLTVMRWAGKAPPTVCVFKKEALVGEIQQAGFIEVEQPEVGTDSITAFMVARKPQ